MGAYSFLDLITRTSFTLTNSSMSCCADSNSIQRTEKGTCVYLLYYSVTFLSVWNYSRKDTSPTPPNQSDLVHSHQRESWIHDREKEIRKEKQTYFCAEIDGRSVFCSVLENSSYCWDWSQICCAGSPSDLQVILWKQERPFYGEIVLLNNEKSRNFFF